MRTWLLICVAGGIALLVACKSTPSTAGPGPKPKPATTELTTAVDKARQGNEPKKTVIVFTDGEDKNSYYTYEQLLDKTRESDVQVYIVAFLDLDFSNQRGFFGIGKSKREKVEKKINAISTYTGGKAFFPNDTQEFGKIFQSIAYELRHQYRLAYVSSNQVWDGTWRDIDVVVKNARRRGLKVRNKKGYLAKKE